MEHNHETLDFFYLTVMLTSMQQADFFPFHYVQVPVYWSCSKQELLNYVNFVTLEAPVLIQFTSRRK